MPEPLADLPVYQVTLQGLDAAARTVDAASRGDQDYILTNAIQTMAFAAVVAHRMGDPIGAAMLEALRRHDALRGDESWDAKARALARVEHALTTKHAAMEQTGRCSICQQAFSGSACPMCGAAVVGA